MDFKNAINKKKDSDDASSDEYHAIPPPAYDPPYVPMHGRSYANFMILPEDLPGNIRVDGEEWVDKYYDEIRAHFGTLVNVLRVHFPGRKICLDKKGRLYRDFFQLTYDTSSRSS
jgi:hypothetical protein